LDFWTNAVVRGNQIFLRGVRDGQRFRTKVDYQPTLYSVEIDEKTPTSFKSIYGRAAQPVLMPDIKSARTFIERGYYGFDRFAYMYLAETYRGKVEYDPSKILKATIDIETMADDGMPDPADPRQEITAITVSLNGRMFSWGCRPYTPASGNHYYQALTERDMLGNFIHWWSHPDNCPDLITGWNIEHFDMPYLVTRIRRVLGQKMAENLSPWGVLREVEIFHQGKNKTVYQPLGISVLDYMRIYHKLAVMTRAVSTPDDYKLNTIAATEVGEKKVDYSEFESLHELYLRDFQKYLDYNVHDVELVNRIDDKRQIIDLILAMAYNAKVNYEDMLGSVRAWECIMHHKLLDRGIVLPPRRENKSRPLVGAFVKDSPPAGYDWVVSFDLNSLYSHLIMEWNISPETRVGKLSVELDIDQILAGELLNHKQELVDKEAIVAANMQLFTRRKKGYLPQILEEMYDERVLAKQAAIQASKDYEATKDPVFKKAEAKWKNMDKVHKTNLNAAYGVLTNKYFLFYDHPNAEAITLSGQMAIKWIEKKVNEFLNRTLGGNNKDYIIAMDTDSIYVDMSGIVQMACKGKSKDEIVDFLDVVSRQKMEQYIEDSYLELAHMVHAREQKMKMKRESIADRGIWAGKKNYVLNTLDKEGVRYAVPEIEMKGIAAVKSSTPPACRTKLKEAIKLIMSGTESEVNAFVSDFRREFDTLPFSEIAFPRGVTEIDKWLTDSLEDGEENTGSGTPVHVKASVVYNEYIRAKGLKEYPPISSGDKIKFVYLKLPNELREEVFGTAGPIPRGLDIDKYIDREKMFQTGFLNPLSTLLGAIGWTGNQGPSLEDFMGKVEKVKRPRQVAELESTGSLDDFFK
jgi:DNA polymerase elongation subunit (family B)